MRVLEFSSLLKTKYKGNEGKQRVDGTIREERGNFNKWEEGRKENRKEDSVHKRNKKTTGHIDGGHHILHTAPRRQALPITSLPRARPLVCGIIQRLFWHQPGLSLRCFQIT